MIRTQLALAALIGFASLAQAQDVAGNAATGAVEIGAGVTGRDDRAAFYAQRYALDDPFEKLTDNHGEGFEPLYGTRNFRTILNGIAYRGGANNSYNRNGKRDNQNPLPAVGLESLCEEGFAEAFYLYSTNFDTAPGVTRCRSVRNADQTLTYLQASPIDEQQSYEVLETIYETIQDRREGPVYLHCWNGWHASGLMAAKVLRQFCGLSADEAVRYWDQNTDGHNTETSYESIRKRIREFTPYPELAITPDQAAVICPAMPDL